MKKRYLGGQLTIFFGLIMITILSLVLLLIEGARNSAIKLSIASVYRTAGESVLAGYHREVFERYGILLFDASSAEEKMAAVMKRNWESDLVGEMLGVSDLMALQPRDIRIERVSLATDDDGEVVQRQCVLCMEEAYGISYLKEMMELFGYVEEQGIINQEFTVVYDENVITGADIMSEVSEGELSKTFIPDTFDWLERKALSFLLGGEQFSGSILTKEERVSERKLEVGEGLPEELAYGNNHWNKLLFLEYLLSHTGNYVAPLADGHLTYQVEYLLNGREEDAENLWETARRLLELRTGANVVGILIDEEKALAVKDLSESLATAIGNPEILPVIYGALLLIWADVEGIYDVKRLLDGKEVSLIKRKDEWLIDATWISAVAQLKEEEEGNSQERPQEQSEARLEDVVTFPDFAIDLKQTEAKEDRLGYEDYLRIMLWLENEKQVAIRFLDIVESDIKSVTEDTEFNLNRYADRIWVRANVHSEYEKEFSIYREFGY